MPKSRKLFFVYGTMKEGGYYSNDFEEFRTKVMKATVVGTLYNLGPFPAMTLKGDNIVHGEVHEYKDADYVTKKMDMIEGYWGPGENNLYERVEVDAFIEGEGEPTKVETYILARRIEWASKIASGEWKI